MADVFISYAREDREIVAALAKSLARAGYSVWWDHRLVAGAEFSATIERELKAATVVVVLWTGVSVKSHWVRDEAEYAQRTGKLVPLRLGAAEAPIGFRQFQAIDFSGWGPNRRDDAFHELTDALADRITDGAPSRQDPIRESFKSQRIKYCRAGDGTSIAYALMGEGMPVVKAGNMLTHIELDARSFAWRHVFDALARNHQLLRYDIRGMGLSERNVEDVSFDDYVSDLEAVVDAAGFERFALLGFSQGCAVSIAYATRHPERVTCMALTAAYARGWRLRLSPTEQQREEAFLDIVRTSWNDANPLARQLFTTALAPRASRREMDEFNELLARTTSAKSLVDNLNAMAEIDISNQLAAVQAPTCLFHFVRDTMNASIDEAQSIASEIPGADLLALDSDSHLILEDDAVWPEYRDELNRFLHQHNHE